MIEPNQNLLNAVVIQAAYDYMHAMINEKLHRDKREDLERWFTGDTFHLYSELDGQALLDKLQRMVKENNYTLPRQMTSGGDLYLKGE